MTRIIINETLRIILPDLSLPLELCDENGRVLARIVPVVEPASYVPWEPSFSEEDLRRQEEAGKWHTTAEVLAQLK